jgi:hypothetical protein
MREGFGADQRSISEVVGYVLVFGLVLTSVGLVTFSGLGSLEDARDSEQANNAQRAFDVIADNMASIHERNAPSRATEVDLPDSEIYLGSEVRMRVEGDGETLADRRFEPIVHRLSKNRKLVYEGGAVFREGQEGGIVIRDPPMMANSERVHVPIIATYAPAPQSAGSTTILLRGKSTQRSVLASDTTGEYDNVTVTVQSSRYDLWERTLSNQGFDCTVDESAVQVSCHTEDPQQVYVTLQRIEVTLLL